MKFYSYEYLLRRNITIGRIQLIIIAIIFVFLIFSLLRYYKNKRDTKYRELALIALFCIIFLGLLQLNRVIELQNTDKQYQAVLRSVQSIAKGLKVQEKEVYINTTQMRGEPLICVDGIYYRVITVNDNNYVLEPIELIGSNIELIEE
jgi:hypothetical protein